MKNTAISRQKSVWPEERDSRVAYYLRPRAKRVRINVDAARRRIMVSVPGHVGNLPKAKRFAAQKWDWIQVQLEALPPAQPLYPESEILLFGETFTLKCPSTRGRAWVDDTLKTVNVPALPETFSGRTRRFLMREARRALTERTQIYADRIGKTVAKISVRDTSSRWGSCKQGRAGGEISYSWRLICAPPFVLDYVVAHECAHLVHADHSKRYWALLDTMVDTVKPANTWLNKNGARLHAVGAEH